MEIKDISLEIEPGMPVWPGDDPVVLHRKQKIEDGKNANVSFLSLSVHTGTHIDAPFHFLQDGNTVDTIPMELLVGETQVINIPESDRWIDAQVLEHAAIQPGITRVLFKTSNSVYWQNNEKKFTKDFVAITDDGAKWIVDHGIKTVGIDYLSIAPFGNSRPTHRTLLGAKTLVIEGVNLSGIEPGIWMMYCLPLKLKGSDGAPARVILIRE
jgi:arylformamidase